MCQQRRKAADYVIGGQAFIKKTHRFHFTYEHCMFKLVTIRSYTLNFEHLGARWMENSTVKERQCTAEIVDYLR